MNLFSTTSLLSCVYLLLKLTTTPPTYNPQATNPNLIKTCRNVATARDINRVTCSEISMRGYTCTATEVQFPAGRCTEWHQSLLDIGKRRNAAQRKQQHQNHKCQLLRRAAFTPNSHHRQLTALWLNVAHVTAPRAVGSLVWYQKQEPKTTPFPERNNSH